MPADSPSAPSQPSVSRARSLAAFPAGRYTDVWARRGASWVCVAANVTRL